MAQPKRLIPPRISTIELEFLTREYQAGLLSNVAIGKELGKSETWVRRWAEKMNLVKEKHPFVQRDAQSVEMASKIVTKESAEEHRIRVTQRILDEHSSNWDEMRQLAASLLKELRILSEYPEEMSKIAELVASASFPEDSDGKLVAERMAMYEKLLTLSTRSKDLLTLSAALTKITNADRKRIGLDRPGTSSGGGVDGLGVTPESLLSHIINNKEEITVNMQINNYRGSE